MATTFPFGYNRPPGGGPQGMGTMLTWDQMMTKKTVRNLHPEVRRRFKALIEAAAAAGVHLGVGTGWRVQPNPPPPGFAKPGNSWHESCPVSPTTETALAIDTVCDVSWDWLEHHCAVYGFRTFRYVGKEPWHIQPIEIPASRSYATKLPPLRTWSLPGDRPPPTGDDNVIVILESQSNPREFNAVFFAVADAQGRSIEVQWSGSGDNPQVRERIKTMDQNFGPRRNVLLAGLKNNRLAPPHTAADIDDSLHDWVDSDFAP
jgi:hypothetical protein